MKIFRTMAAVLLAGASTLCMAVDGLVQVQSAHSVKATADKFEALANERGLTVFIRVDHAAGAATVGKTLRPTEVIIFGSPKAGTPFMECAQTVGIDLPLKALVWEDAEGRVWLGYNDPAFLGQRHEAGECPVIGNIGKALSGLAEAATAQ